MHLWVQRGSVWSGTYSVMMCAKASAARPPRTVQYILDMSSAVQEKRIDRGWTPSSVAKRAPVARARSKAAGHWFAEAIIHLIGSSMWRSTHEAARAMMEDASAVGRAAAFHTGRQPIFHLRVHSTGHSLATRIHLMTSNWAGSGLPVRVAGLPRRPLCGLRGRPTPGGHGRGVRLVRLWARVRRRREGHQRGSVGRTAGVDQSGCGSGHRSVGRGALVNPVEYAWSSSRRRWKVARTASWSRVVGRNRSGSANTIILEMERS
jgi:hypothetical protein